MRGRWLVTAAFVQTLIGNNPSWGEIINIARRDKNKCTGGPLKTDFSDNTRIPLAGSRQVVIAEDDEEKEDVEDEED